MEIRQILFSERGGKDGKCISESILSLFSSKEGRKVAKIFGVLCHSGRLSGKGIGCRLFQSVADCMKEQKVPAFYLFTDISCNYRFYAHLGIIRRGKKAARGLGRRKRGYAVFCLRLQRLMRYLGKCERKQEKTQNFPPEESAGSNELTDRIAKGSEFFFIFCHNIPLI